MTQADVVPDQGEKHYQPVMASDKTGMHPILILQPMLKKSSWVSG